jgi:hypothetical protein
MDRVLEVALVERPGPAVSPTSSAADDAAGEESVAH